jgi:hypothetical protein
LSRILDANLGSSKVLVEEPDDPVLPTCLPRTFPSVSPVSWISARRSLTDAPHTLEFDLANHVLAIVVRRRVDDSVRNCTPSAWKALELPRRGAGSHWPQAKRDDDGVVMPERT